MIAFILIATSIAIAGIAAYYYMEKSGDKLQELDSSLTNEEVKKGSPKLKSWLEDNKNELTTKKKEAGDLESELKTKEDEGEKKTIQDKIDKKQKEISELTKKQQLVQSVHDWGAWYPTLTWNNMLWTGGIFIVITAIGVFISKWIAALFKEEKE